MTHDRVVPADHMHGIFLGASLNTPPQQVPHATPQDKYKSESNGRPRPQTARFHGRTTINQDGFMTSNVTRISISESPVQQQGLFSCNRLMSRPGTKNIQTTVLREVHHSYSPLQSKQLSPRHSLDNTTFTENGNVHDNLRTKSSMSGGSSTLSSRHSHDVKEKTREILLTKLRERHEIEETFSIGAARQRDRKSTGSIDVVKTVSPKHKRPQSSRYREHSVIIPTENLTSSANNAKLKRPRSTPYNVTSIDSGVEFQSQYDEPLGSPRHGAASFSSDGDFYRSYYHSNKNIPSPPRKSPDRLSPHSTNMSSIRAWVSSTGPATIKEETQSRILQTVDDDDDVDSHVIEKANDNTTDNDNDSVFSSSGTENNIMSPASIDLRSHQNTDLNNNPKRTLSESKQNVRPKSQSYSSNSLQITVQQNTNPSNFHNEIISPKRKTLSTNSDSSSTTIINVISPENEIQEPSYVDEMDDDLGYLDSYSDAVPLQQPRRGSLWSKLRFLGPTSLMDRATTPSERSRGTISGFRSKSSTFGSSASSEAGGSTSDGGTRCPNCHEKLIPAATSRYVVVKGNEKSFLGWILSKWAGRKELQKHGNPGEVRSSGYMPHYCNFVRSKAIHDRPKGGPGSADDLDKDEDVDDGYITNTELSPTSGNNAASRKKPVNRQSSTSSKKVKDETDSLSEGILRATSPTISTGYDPESLFDRLREQGLAGSNSALNDSNVEEDLLGSPHVNFDIDEDIIEKGSSSHDVTTQTTNVDTLISRSSTPARDPIQIPSIDENSNDLLQNTTKDNKENASLVSKLLKDQESKSAENQKSKRTPCVKKEKMPGKEKKKKGKKKVKTEDVVEAVPPPEITQVSEEANKGPSGEDNSVPQVNVTIPDLPTLNAHSKDTGKSSKKKTKKSIGAPSKKSEKAETPKTETKSEPGRFYDFGDLSMATNSLEDRTLGKPTVKVPSYLNDRMVLSLQSSRFELPMDMKSLEKMSPKEYLKKHCVVSTRRKTLYQKIFTKYKEKAGWVPGKHLMRCLKDVLVNTITTDQVEELNRLLGVETDSQIDFQFFCGIAALAERILYPQFLTEDTADCTEYQKEKVEVADFCSLEWKLNGVQVSSNIKQLLETIS